MVKNSQKTHKGFSLAEILISMAIVGVIGGMMIVGISKASPERKKVMFLRAYHGLEAAIVEIINDPTKYSQELYSGADRGENWDFSSDPYNTAQSRECGGAITKDNAVCCFVADHFNIVGTVTCGADVETNFQASNGVCFGHMGGAGHMTIDPLCDGHRIVVTIAADGGMTVPSSLPAAFDGTSATLQEKAAKWMTEQSKLGDEDPDLK